ncbi:RHS repeat-associated core domain-containing protein [Pseudomonas laurentiana]
MNRSSDNASSTLLFYAEGKMVCQFGAGSTRLMRAGSYLIAQSQRATMLLQVDMANTVIAGRADEYAESQSFAPYGFSPVRDLAPIAQFNGEWRDPRTGSYPLGQGHRSFSSITGRFFSPDLLSPFGKGWLNAYAYCAGDPVNFHDPSGRMKKGFTPAFGRPPTQRNLAHALDSADLPSTLELLIENMVKHDPYAEHVFWRTSGEGKGRKYEIKPYKSASNQDKGHETYFNFGQGAYDIEVSGWRGKPPPESALLRVGELHATWSEKVGWESYRDAGFEWAGDPSKHPLGILLDSPRSLAIAPNLRNRFNRHEQNKVSDIRNPSRDRFKYD